jgi:hypothetical protein
VPGTAKVGSVPPPPAKPQPSHVESNGAASLAMAAAMSAQAAVPSSSLDVKLQSAPSGPLGGPPDPFAAHDSSKLSGPVGATPLVPADTSVVSSPASATGSGRKTLDPTVTVPPVEWHAPAPRKSRTLVFALVGSVGFSLVLLGAVTYLLVSRKDTPAPPAVTVAKSETPPPVPEHPITVAEGGPATAAPVAPSAPAARTNPGRPVVTPHGKAPVPPVAARARPGRPDDGKPELPPPTGKGLSSRQSELARIYGDDEKGPAQAVVKARIEERPTEQVPEVQIRAVVSRNKKSLSNCYDRVLKHDSSLKSLRVDVDLKIGISGGVTQVSFPDPQYADSELGTCLSQMIRRWHFPSQDREYETSFPLLLQAN